MKALAVVGQTGSGKTTFVKNTLATLGNAPKFIYDVNAEYYTKKNLPDFEKFLQIVNTKENSVIVFEEATIFLNNRSANSEIIRMLVRKRHANNFIILVFHSLRSVPVYITDLINYLVLFKTNDRATLVEQKFKNDDRILSLYNAVSKARDKHFHIVKQMA